MPKSWKPKTVSIVPPGYDRGNAPGDKPEAYLVRPSFRRVAREALDFIESCHRYGSQHFKPEECAEALVELVRHAPRASTRLAALKLYMEQVGQQTGARKWLESLAHAVDAEANATTAIVSLQDLAASAERYLEAERVREAAGLGEASGEPAPRSQGTTEQE